MCACRGPAVAVDRARQGHAPTARGVGGDDQLRPPRRECVRLDQPTRSHQRRRGRDAALGVHKPPVSRSAKSVRKASISGVALPADAQRRVWCRTFTAASPPQRCLPSPEPCSLARADRSRPDAAPPQLAAVLVVVVAAVGDQLARFRALQAPDAPAYGFRIRPPEAVSPVPRATAGGDYRPNERTHG
jgi:hypothetical protein